MCFPRGVAAGPVVRGNAAGRKHPSYMKSYPETAPAPAERRWVGRLKSELPVLIGVVVVGALAYLYSMG